MHVRPVANTYCWIVLIPGTIRKDMVFPIVKQLLLKNGIKERKLREYFNGPHYQKCVSEIAMSICDVSEVLSNLAVAGFSFSGDSPHHTILAWCAAFAGVNVAICFGARKTNSCTASTRPCHTEVHVARQVHRTSSALVSR